MKGNPVLIIVTHLNPLVFGTLPISEIIEAAQSKLQASELENRGFGYKNEY
jgi:hypothetical protein